MNVIPTSTLKEEFGRVNVIYSDIYPPIHYQGDLLGSQLSNYYEHLNATALAVFDTDQWKVEHLSKNFYDLFGYSSTEFSGKYISYLFNLIAPTHTHFILKSLLWTHTQFNNLKYRRATDVLSFGLDVIHKQQRTLRISVKQYVINEVDSSRPTRILLILQDVSHLLKHAGPTCTRLKFVSDKGDHRTATYWFPQEHFFDTDIISEREREVLRLVAEGFDSKDIGEMLFLSTSTVNTHRRNMIARTGAKDTTALIQLSKFCDFF